jgi:hypothetical protein
MSMNESGTGLVGKYKETSESVKLKVFHPFIPLYKNAYKRHFCLKMNGRFGTLLCDSLGLAICCRKRYCQHYAE